MELLSNAIVLYVSTYLPDLRLQMYCISLFVMYSYLYHAHVIEVAYLDGAFSNFNQLNEPNCHIYVAYSVFSSN
jgi:hypothetical protein